MYQNQLHACLSVKYKPNTGLDVRLFSVTDLPVVSHL